jgi:hypothetical protein
MVIIKPQMQFVNGEGFKQRSRHYAQHLHYARQCVTEGKMNVEYIESALNAADIFTKPIVCAKLFRFLRSLLGMVYSKVYPNTDEDKDE